MSREAQSVAGGRHRLENDYLLFAHVRKFTSFSLIGAFVLVAGIGVQWALVRRAGPDLSYAGQAVFSIELSYVLNRWLTWGDRQVASSASLLKWNVQRLTMTVPNYLGYAALIRFAHLNWLAANLGVTAVFVVVNYVLGDRWSFAPARVAVVPRPETPPLERDWLPTVSVVIPCKNNPSTIGPTVRSLLDQDYRDLAEVIVVGDVGDPTWNALRDIDDPRLIVVEHAPVPGKRDPNAKRHEGILKSSGDVIALADSDIVMDPDWLRRGVAMLRRQGSGLVAGGMCSIHDSFWGRFVDGNVLAAKTPRVPEPYQVTARNFGRRGYKPPITANAIFFREMYNQTELDSAWFYGYEDYEWLWRVAKDGHKIVFSSELTSAHHHRRSYRKLLQEYARSSEGCAAFIRRHPDCPLARKRLAQAVGIPLAFLGALVIAGWSVAAGQGSYVAELAGAILLALAAREVVQTRRVEAVAYPLIGLSLAGAFTLNLARNLIMHPTEHVERVQTWEEESGVEPEARRVRRFPWPLAAVLAVQAAFSLSLVWSNTAFGDEANYLQYGRLEWLHWLHGTSITPAALMGYSGVPQLYPAIGGLASMIGGLAAARILSLCFMLAATALLYAIGVRLFGERAALIGVALWAVSEPVLRLAFATYDPMACLLVVLSVWIAVQVPTSKYKGELVALTALALGLGAATAFAFAIYIPVIVVVAFLYWQSQLGTRLAIWCSAWLTAGTFFVVFGILTALRLWLAAFDTTVNRGAAHIGGLGVDVAAVARSAWSWDGFLFAVGCVGVVAAIATERTWGRKLLVAALAASIVVVPLYQSYIGTDWAMDKHLSTGSGLAALAAGYGLANFKPAWRRGLVAAAAIAFLAYPAITGLWYARSTFHSWASVSKVVSVLKTDHSNGPVYLTNTTNQPLQVILRYYFPNLPEANPSLIQLTSTKYSQVVLALTSPLGSLSIPRGPLTDNPGLAKGILRIASSNTAIDYRLVKALEADTSYRLVAVSPYTTDNTSNAAGFYVIWQRVGGAQ
jgi:GT2 family glycosyltransferase